LVFGLRFIEPFHVRRATGEEQAGKDFLDDCADGRKGERRIDRRPHPFLLQKGVGDRGDHHVVVPARIRSALEVVEAELRLEVLVVLLDGPPLVREPDDRRREAVGGSDTK
jgi:hypothetical protein